MKKILFHLLSLVLLSAPLVASAHAGVEPSSWLEHVFSQPFAAPDHVLTVFGAGLIATAILMHLAGIAISSTLKKNWPRRVSGYTGAAIALVGLILLI